MWEEPLRAPKGGVAAYPSLATLGAIAKNLDMLLQQECNPSLAKG